MLKDTFIGLGLPETAYRVYLCLVENGASSARKVATDLGIPRPSVYDNLKLLIQKGIVSEREDGNKKVFQIEDPKNLTQLIELKIESLKEQKQEISKIIPELAKHLIAVEPKIKFYAGKEGVRQVLRDLLWYEDLKTYAMWPISEMVEILGAEYIKDFTRRKVSNKLWSYVIWPQDKLIDFKAYPFLGVGWKYLRDIRLAPKGMSWNMSYWLYADKVAFISSRQESFGMVIHSRDFAELILAQFKEIWKVSEPVKRLKNIPKPF